jgi:hypothetical protein
VNGQRLPYILATAGEEWLSISAGSVWLNETGVFRHTVVLQLVERKETRGITSSASSWRTTMRRP